MTRLHFVQSLRKARRFFSHATDRDEEIWSPEHFVYHIHLFRSEPG